MPPRKEKLPIASAGAEDVITIDDTGWERIEKTYGHSIAPNVRNELLDVTNQYLYWVAFEHNAPPRRDAVERAKELKKAAAKFGERLSHSDRKINQKSAKYAKFVIAENFDDVRLIGRDRFDSLAGVISSFFVACNLAIRKLESPDQPGFRDGEDWGLWILRLTDVMKSHDLPWRVRKDVDKSDSVSPFVCLVWELQQHIPYRRHATEGALSKGITSARANKTGPIKT